MQSPGIYALHISIYYIYRCIATIATPVVPVNKSENLQVGECDHGPIEYTFYKPGKNHNKYVSFEHLHPYTIFIFEALHALYISYR
jgi:hypothetical protein